ncbi:MAG: tyrosine--tRNA ligase [Phycisphaerales bacterium]|nr:tyrosine--tRNA ligase [Phycisphaerales bacterium]MCI0674318.1 tyrosine--tRNA ligase [Phycisphaerales bacterium]
MQVQTTTASNFLDELKWRGLLHQTTAADELTRHLARSGRVAYCGFDPTSESLTIGNFIQIKLLMHWQQAGHKPIVVIGGGTGLIGDPSGKDAERQLMTADQVEANVAGQRRIFERLLDFDRRNPNAAVLVNNADWLTKLGFIDVLRDVGKYFSINTMIQKESVKERLHNREQGISYTEFSYMVLQAYDFLHLRRAMNCTVQTAGSDQYGNIVAGIDLIRREFGHDQAFGITSPLVKAASGKKIGKTEKGAIWLTADRTSPYAFYQYWINVEDQDVASFLRWFTVLGQEKVDDILRQHDPAPHQRIAQRELARHMTRLIHGETELARVESASQALFGGDVRKVDPAMLDEVFADVPHSSHSRSLLEGGGLSLVELLPQTTLATSKREAREFIASGAVSINGVKVDADRPLTASDLLHGRTILLKRGKKQWHATKWA